MWIARVFNDPPITLIQDEDNNVFIKHFPYPDIYTIGTWIRNRPGVYKMAFPNPITDTKQTRKYVEYKFAVFMI